MDMVLLRDLAPLLSVEFMYQWGTELDKINGAIMRMRKGSLLGRILLGFLPHVPASPASTDWGSTLYGAVRQVYKEWVIFPCAFFNTEWQLFWNMSESAHPFKCNPEQSSELFDGVFAWHWHNKWDAPIEEGSKFAILEKKICEKYGHEFDYMVSREKRHLGGNRGGGDPGTFSPNLWKHLIETYSIKSVMDIGCGQGHAVNWFQNAGVIAIGVDGLPENLKNSPPNCFEHDLTEYALEGTPVDLIWCCEVVEHIEEKYIDNILQSFTNGQYIAMTYATPGQSGYHHVNCQEKEYWINKLESIGYVFLQRETDTAREIAENGWFKKNGLLFVKGVKI
jgi:SAM-dependent methyltransferase